MQSILDAINEWIKEILIGAINGNLSTMFGDVNEKVGTIAAEVAELSETPAVEPSDQTSKTVRHAPLVYRVEEIAQLLAISSTR